MSALDGLAVVDVGAGRAHSVALTDQGEVWAWGSGKGGRLGTGCNQVCEILGISLLHSRDYRSHCNPL